MAALAWALTCFSFFLDSSCAAQVLERPAQSGPVRPHAADIPPPLLARGDAPRGAGRGSSVSYVVGGIATVVALAMGVRFMIFRGVAMSAVALANAASATTGRMAVGRLGAHVANSAVRAGIGGRAVSVVSAAQRGAKATHVVSGAGALMVPRGHGLR